MSTRSCRAVAFVALVLFADGEIRAEPAADAIEKGNACLEKQDFGAAITAFTEAIRVNPRSAEAYRGRARAYLQNGEPRRAIPDYSEALRINPRYVEAYWGRGGAYRNIGSFDKAFEDCAEALRLNPKSVEAYSNRGSIYLKKGDLNTAIADFSKAIGLNPKLPEAHYGRGLAHFRRNDFDEAIRDFTEAIRLNPKLTGAYRARGIAHSEKREAAEAEADFAQAKKLADAKLGLIRGEMWEGWEPLQVAKSPDEVVQMLQKHGLNVKVVAPADRNVESLAGHYTDGPGLSGRECYLFSDASYIYTEWADILPETIYEKGTWSVQDGWVVWKPDGSLPRDIFPKDHVYAPLLLNEGSDVYLMSHRWHFSYFQDHAEKRSPDDFMFKLCALRRESQPTKAAQEEKKRDLMRRAWRPDFFKEDDSKESRR